MKKRKILLSVLLLGCTAAIAQENVIDTVAVLGDDNLVRIITVKKGDKRQEIKQSNVGDSTITIKNPHYVTITNKKNTVKVYVQGKEQNSNWRYSLERNISRNNEVYTINQSQGNWDFNIPFISKKQKKNNEHKQYQRARFSLNLLGDLQFGMGLVGATKQAAGMDVEMSNAGFEFFLNNLFNWEYNPTRNTSLSLGFGVDWRNYRMKGNTRFIKQDGQIQLGSYPQGADIDFSRLKVFSITLELMLNQRLFGNVHLGAGGVVNFNTHGSLKTRYTIGSGKDKEGFKETTNNIHQKAVTFDLKGQLSIRPIAFYVKYSPMNVLDTEYGPKFRSISAGALIQF